MRSVDSGATGAISSILGMGRPMSRGGRHGMFSMMIFGRSGGKRMSPAQRKKASRRKARRFVDHIVMHHRRLHEHNRNIPKNEIKKRAVKKERDKKKTKEELEKKLKFKWRDKYARNRGLDIRARLQSRRARSKRCWRDLINEIRRQRGDNYNYEDD